LSRISDLSYRLVHPWQNVKWLADAISGYPNWVGFGNFQSAIQTTTTQMVPAERLTQTTATYFICYEFALGFGPSMIGFVQPFLGYQNLFIVMAVIALIGIVLYYFIHG